MGFFPRLGFEIAWFECFFGGRKKRKKDERGLESYHGVLSDLGGFLRWVYLLCFFFFFLGDGFCYADGYI
jgi:hypothetical protein